MRSYHHLQKQNPTTTGQWLNNHGKVGVMHFYHMVSSIKRLSLMFAAVSGLELARLQASTPAGYRRNVLKEAAQLRSACP